LLVQFLTEKNITDEVKNFGILSLNDTFITKASEEIKNSTDIKTK